MKNLFKSVSHMNSNLKKFIYHGEPVPKFDLEQYDDMAENMSKMKEEKDRLQNNTRGKLKALKANLSTENTTDMMNRSDVLNKIHSISQFYRKYAVNAHKAKEDLLQLGIEGVEDYDKKGRSELTRKFQEKAGLIADGWFGKNTEAAKNSILAKVNSGKPLNEAFAEFKAEKKAEAEAKARAEALRKLKEEKETVINHTLKRIDNLKFINNDIKEQLKKEVIELQNVHTKTDFEAKWNKVAEKINFAEKVEGKVLVSPDKLKGFISWGEAVLKNFDNYNEEDKNHIILAAKTSDTSNTNERVA